MTYQTLLVNEAAGGLIVTINRPSQQNAINNQFLKELNQVLDAAEEDNHCRTILLEGQQGFFCTGMDFGSFAREFESRQLERESALSEPQKESLNQLYMQTIRRCSLSPKIIISVVDGKVMAGGMGLIATSDLVFATSRSQFSLSEALWGLLPAMVTPYLIRRIGYQAAYKLTLTTMSLNGQQALGIGLVDELSDSPYEILRRYLLKLTRLEESTIASMKNYFRKMWIITDQMEGIAIEEISRLASSPKVIKNITNYVKYQKFPWDQV